MRPPVVTTKSQVCATPLCNVTSSVAGKAAPCGLAVTATEPLGT